MSVITLSVSDYATLLRTRDCVCAGQVGGYLYAVVKGEQDENIYRVAVT